MRRGDRSIMDAANAALAAGGSGYVVGDAPGQAPAGGGASRIIPCAGVESRIIGKGGQNIRALRERTGAQIKVRNETRDAEITGHPQAVEAAAAAIEEIIHNFNTTGSAGPGPGGGGGRGGGGAATAAATPSRAATSSRAATAAATSSRAATAAATSSRAATAAARPGVRSGRIRPGCAVRGLSAAGARLTAAAAAARAGRPHRRDGPPPGWQELSANGQVYYWNTETNVTQYERPQ